MERPEVGGVQTSVCRVCFYVSVCGSTPGQSEEHREGLYEVQCDAQHRGAFQDCEVKGDPQSHTTEIVFNHRTVGALSRRITQSDQCFI